MPGHRLESGRLRRLAAMLTALGTAVLLPACGGGSEGGGSSDGGGGSLAIAIGTEPRTLDVLTAEDGQTTLFQFNVYETLAFRGGDALELEPRLAEEWEVAGNVWTFRLRDGVTFHDGSEFTAEDVVASFERLMQPDSELAGTRASGVADVRAVDDLTVEIETESPDPTVPAKVSLVPIVAAELADISSDEISSTMNGTGPYRFERWDRGEGIELTAAGDDYWGEAPGDIESVSLRFLEEDSTRMASLRTEEIDIALNMPSEFSDQAPAIVTGASPDVYSVFFNTENGGAFTDQRLREAASLAIDRQSIIDNILGGNGEQVRGQFVGQYVFGSTPSLDDQAYDADRARQLVGEAGGASIVLASPTGRWPKDREIAQAVAGMLEDVGFTVQVELPELGTWLESLFATGEGVPDAWLAGHGNDIFDMERSVSWMSCDGEISHYCNEEIDTIAAAARAELDENARQELYDQMWQVAEPDFGWAAITTIEQVHFTSEAVTWSPRADNFILFEEMELS